MRMLLLLILVALAGCGYHHGFRSDLQPFPEGHGIRSDPASFQQIAIPVFENLTFEPLLEKRVHEIFKETFVTRGWKVVDLDQASTVLSGKINRFERAPIALNLQSQAEEYRIKVGLALTLGSKEGSAPPQKIDAEGSAEYIARTDPAEDRAGQDRAIREAARRLAERAADLLSERSLPSQTGPAKR